MPRWTLALKEEWARSNPAYYVYEEEIGFTFSLGLPKAFSVEFKCFELFLVAKSWHFCSPTSKNVLSVPTNAFSQPSPPERWNWWIPASAGCQFTLYKYIGSFKVTHLPLHMVAENVVKFHMDFAFPFSSRVLLVRGRCYCSVIARPLVIRPISTARDSGEVERT